MNVDREAASRQNNRSRRLGIAGSFTGQQWIDLCNRYGNICLQCGENRPLTPDHVIPLSANGTNDISNIQPLCHPCNRHKHASTVDYRDESPEKREKRLHPRPTITSFELGSDGKPTGLVRFGYQPGDQWVTIEAVDYDDLQQKMKVFR